MDRVVRADPTWARDYGTTEKPIKTVRIYKNKVPPAASCLNDSREVDTETIKKVAAKRKMENGRKKIWCRLLYSVECVLASGPVTLPNIRRREPVSVCTV
jgi:hypothetical protein